MPELDRRYMLIAPDLRLTGDSDKPAAGYDKYVLAKYLYQATNNCNGGMRLTKLTHRNR